MDDYYSNLTVSEDFDDDMLFKHHVVREVQELEHIDNFLKSAFAEIDD